MLFSYRIGCDDQALDEYPKIIKEAQDVSSKNGSRVHAYLHRKEGDVGNAGYWYQRAGKSFFQDSLEKEWEELAGDFLSKASE